MVMCVLKTFIWSVCFTDYEQYRRNDGVPKKECKWQYTIVKLIPKALTFVQIMGLKIMGHVPMPHKIRGVWLYHILWPIKILHHLTVSILMGTDIMKVKICVTKPTDCIIRTQTVLNACHHILKVSWNWDMLKIYFLHHTLMLGGFSEHMEHS
jgi:hypothetical protein